MRLAHLGFNLNVTVKSPQVPASGAKATSRLQLLMLCCPLLAAAPSFSCPHRVHVQMFSPLLNGAFVLQHLRIEKKKKKGRPAGPPPHPTPASSTLTGPRATPNMAEQTQAIGPAFPPNQPPTMPASPLAFDYSLGPSSSPSSPSLQTAALENLTHWSHDPGPRGGCSSGLWVKCQAAGGDGWNR